MLYAHVNVTLTVSGVTAEFYQPSEGGWRVREDGPLRLDGRGMVKTYPTLEDAATAIFDLAIETKCLCEDCGEPIEGTSESGFAPLAHVRYNPETGHMDSTCDEAANA